MYVVVNEQAHYLTLAAGRIIWTPNIEEALRYPEEDLDEKARFMARAYGGEVRSLKAEQEAEKAARELTKLFFAAVSVVNGATEMAPGIYQMHPLNMQMLREAVNEVSGRRDKETS